MTSLPEPEHLSLAAEFPPATREDWLRLVSATLKGADFEKRLVSRTYDGLRIQPLYHRATHCGPIAGRLPGDPWQILARIDHPDPAAANQEARHELENGATGLSLIFAGSAGAYGYGLDASEAALSGAMEGVHADAGIVIELDLGLETAAAPELMADLIERSGVAAQATQIRFGINPLGTMAMTGGAAEPWPVAAKAFAAQLQALARRGFGGPFAAADGRVVHDAGASEAQELAFVLGCALGYLRALEAAGIAPDDGRRMIFFRMAADADQFLTMAKFRALRMLWARIETACGLDARPILVTGQSAWRMMTRHDPFVNMLRTTLATFAAGVGGANALTLLPFTAAIGLPDRPARRIARNTQLILVEEANIAKVADPAAGSGAIRGLTDELCRIAWALLQEIESAGGIHAALKTGLIQAKVAEVKAAREKAVATRREPLTGTSEFPDLSEVPAAVLDVPRRRPNVTAPTANSFEPLSPHRLAEAFESLREGSDRILGKTGSRPKVFLANLGPMAASQARSGFAKSLFEAGGIEAVTGEALPAAGAVAPGSTDLSALVASFRASGSRLACLCSSDEVYARQAIPAARALTAAGAHLFLAGRPGEHEGAWSAAGIKHYVYAGCDAIAALEAAYRGLG